jgi:hypothetical protein
MWEMEIFLCLIFCRGIEMNLVNCSILEGVDVNVSRALILSVNMIFIIVIKA